MQSPGTTKPEERHSVAGESFQYDAAGNRLSQYEGEHAAPGNRLAFFGDRHFEYDRFGNLTVERRGTAHKLVTTFDYDCRHRLIKRTDPHGRVTTYAYDAFNRRTRKTVDGHTTEYLWQGNKLIAETDNKSHWQTFLYEPDSHRPMATVVGSKRVNSETVRTYWYQNDHLGTPHSLTDIRGNTVWKGRYSAYGQLLEEWTPPDDPYEHPQPKVNNPLRFQGQYEDPESGLHYNLNRYYDPGIGRYLTADPAGLLGDINAYQYCPNPIGWVDPLGLLASLGEQQPKNTWNAFQKAHKGQFGDSTESASAYAKLKNEQSPWPYGYTPTTREMQPGERFNMAMSPNQKDTHPGGFGTFDNISDVSYVRNELAVKTDWKENIDRIVTFEVTKPFNVLEGPVGPQIDGKKYLPGGGSQLEMLLPRDDRMLYLRLISTQEIK